MPLPANFPTSLDVLANPTATTNRDDPGFELDEVVARIHDILEALEAKLGIGASAPAAGGGVLRQTAGGTSAWGKAVPGDLTGPGAGSANTVLRTTDGTTLALGKVLAADLAAGTLQKIGEAVGDGVSPAMQVSGIPGTFRNLVAVVVARSTVSSTNAQVALTFEATPTVSYFHQRLNAFATTVAASENLGVSNSIWAGFSAGATSAAGLHGGVRISLPEYATPGIWRAVGVSSHGGTSGVSGGLIVDVVNGFWANTGAITLIRLVLSAGAWTTTSRLTVYGEPA